MLIGPFWLQHSMATANLKKSIYLGDPESALIEITGLKGRISIDADSGPPGYVL